MATYSELLRDPRWQKARLQKLEAAEWRCEKCMDSESTLNVHHKRYVKGRMPWEYDEGELSVLCESCHEGEHELKDMRNELMARLAMDGPLSIGDFIAYGTGAVARYDWIIDDPALKALVDQVRAETPTQFAAGNIGASVIETLIGRMDYTKFPAVARMFAEDPAFGNSLVALIQAHISSAGGD